MLKKYALAAVLAINLAGCGGGGGSGTPTPTSTTAAGPAPAHKTHATIYLDEDSTGYGADIDSPNKVQYPGIGNGIAGRVDPSPAQMMQADFDAALGAGVVTVIDGSIPGGTLMHSLQGLAPDTAPLATRLAQLTTPADIVITNSEINDQYVLGENVSTYITWMQQWISTVTAAGAVPVYAEPNPICRSDMNLADPQTGTNALVAAADQLFGASGYTALPNLANFENYTTPPNPQPWNIAFMSSDCVHPNDAGYAFKEKNYFAALLPVVRKMLGR
ncbi:SGNH/GDSL hydrolase family protein [Paraburkholderia elongata]|uniref:SGNH hydrolase-type esterase domain-containing protein n=1 Tax=Paraburkholderia elongata TaxID=2675747 RepID=A0A972NWX3_9BURK|nr:SGNH/GDSL hydrolase family protein [Paraburkholderia elongata]NPT59120.1 hypothetical protein [Paraburkholderia elongata]